MSNKLIATILLVLTCVGVAYSGIISRPTKTTGGTSFSDGTIPHASDFNGDADTIYALVNGNIEDANIKNAAAIAGSKINTLFTSNVQVTSASSPCFVNHDSSQGADLKQWRICQSGGVLSIATYTDAGSVITTPLSIARVTGIITASGGLVLSSGNLSLTSGTVTLSALTAKSFLFSGVGGLLTATTAPTNGQILIGNTGNSPTLGTIAGTATHICNTAGAGTFTIDFCANPAITAPVFSGTATGTYTLGGTPSITAPILSGTITGTYTLGGTPSISTINLTGGQVAFPSSQSASAGANTLDDYEEGSWTPAIGGTATYTTQNGKYVKIGSLVTITCELKISVLGTGSTNVISGLPFQPAANGATGAVYWDHAGSALVYLVAKVDASSSNINLFGLTSGASDLGTPIVFTNGANIIFTLSYITAT